MELNSLWSVLIPGFFGWVLGILTNMITMSSARRTQKRDLARLLLAEISFNEGVVRKFNEFHEKISSGQQLKDDGGNPISIDLSNTEILDEQFSFSTFDATLDQHALFDQNLLAALHKFYRLLRQAEQFRKIAEKDTNPLTKKSWNLDLFRISGSAMNHSIEEKLIRRLEKLAK